MREVNTMDDILAIDIFSDKKSLELDNESHRRKSVTFEEY